MNLEINKNCGLNDIFYGLGRFATEYPAQLKDNLSKIFHSHCKTNPLVCFSMLANSLTRQVICDDEFFRDHTIHYSFASIGDFIRNGSEFNPLYSVSPADYPVAQWNYVADKNINAMIIMINVLLDIVQKNIFASIGEYVREAVIEPNKIEGIITEPEGKFMILAIVDETPFYYHAAVSNADGTNFIEDYAAYHAFPILSGLKIFNFGAKPVKILYMQAV